MKSVLITDVNPNYAFPETRQRSTTFKHTLLNEQILLTQSVSKIWGNKARLLF